MVLWDRQWLKHEPLLYSNNKNQLDSSKLLHAKVHLGKGLGRNKLNP
jgi:hypothetical protein